MKKVLIMGCPGSGKARLAVRVGQITGLDVYHIKDDRFSERHTGEEVRAWREAVQKIVDRDGWVIEGTQSITYDIRIQRADTVLFVKQKPLTCLMKFIKKSFRERKSLDAYRLRLTKDMFRKIMAYRKLRVPLINELIEKNKTHLDVVFFEDEDQINRYLENLRKEYLDKK
jgi:adenylate kinase family enzyme